MVPDELPLSDGTSKTQKTLSVVDIQRTIAENIATLVWYAPTNELLIRFINEFCHPDQLTCLTNRELSDEAKQKLITKIRGWEEQFTDAIYRAALIIATKEKAKHPNYKWINIEDIISLSQDLIQKENEGQETARHDTGYPD